MNLTDYTITDLRRMTAGYRGFSHSWEGVLKLDGEIVFTCGCRHRNREQSSRFYPSATSCAEKARVGALLTKAPTPAALERVLAEEEAR